MPLYTHSHPLRPLPVGAEASNSAPTTAPYTEIRLPAFAVAPFEPRPGRRLPSVADFPREEDTPPRVYTLDLLPPPDLVSKVLDAFYTCSGTLFYVVSREESFALFRSVYWGRTRRTKAALAELCAIIAVGSQYDDDRVSEEHRCAFFDTAKIYSDDVLEASDLKAMQLYALCAMFSIMDKRIAAWSYVAAGLKIAQAHGLHRNECPTGGLLEAERIVWRKNWRTLKFLESWLVGTLGRIPDTENNADSDATEDIVHPPWPVDDGNRAPAPMVVDLDVVQSELGKIGFLMSGIMKNIYAAEVCSIRSMQAHMVKLEQWHVNLPPYMRLKTLLDESTDEGSRRSIMLVHLTYLGSMILLTRKIIAELVARPSGSPWLCDGTKEEARHYMDVCIGSAKHVARIVGMLYDDKSLFKRCWLIVNQSFNAIVLLLFHVVQMRRHQRPPAEYVDHLHDAAKLIKVLLFCSSSDNLAHSYLQAISPCAVFFDLADLPPPSPRAHSTTDDDDGTTVDSRIPRNRLTTTPASSYASSSYTSSSAASTSDAMDLDALASHLLHILQTPFGGDGTVQVPHLLPPSSSTEFGHARFWRSRGFEVPAWDRFGGLHRRLPLKRLYDEASQDGDTGDFGREQAWKRRWRTREEERFWTRVT